MFHIGTANPRQKLSVKQIYEELLERVNNGEITEEELPKVTTISNWISGFSRKWKTAMTKNEETFLFLETRVPMDIDKNSRYITFTLGWALKENQKNKREPIILAQPIKRINEQVKNFLEIMFHIGTANPRQKLSVKQIYEELLERVNNGEITEEELPKVTTISNWISGFSRKWKTAMTVRSLEETENLNLPNSS
ncbi:hypothetical protein Glove_315g44 [Diversispora epigaea]|uniref:Uncharacterized protein n=1 Tax=Diversispora epigaea TaxID=1348612 RepID=A0A397HY08_9GLOM|nr:hypothetical protein Glove_315g44 [Diversispora epigaea]